MTITIENFIRKPFEVEAIQVTDENLAEVAKWCKGKLKENDQGAKFILVKVHNAATDRHKQAFKGDWIFYSRSTGYKVYSDRAFNGSFNKKDDGTKPEISVAKVLVDEHNAALAAKTPVVERIEGGKVFETVGATYTEEQALAHLEGASEIVEAENETVEINRDAGTGQFVTDEYAEANPETTVTETVQESELSPEDQARLSS